MPEVGKLLNHAVAAAVNSRVFRVFTSSATSLTKFYSQFCWLHPPHRRVFLY